MPNDSFDPSRANDPGLPAPGQANAIADAEFLDLSGTCLLFGAGNPGIATRFCGACLSTLKPRTLQHIRADWTGRF